MILREKLFSLERHLNKSTQYPWLCNNSSRNTVMIRNNRGKEYLRFKILLSLNIHSYEPMRKTTESCNLEHTIQVEKLLLAAELQLVICISGKSSICTAISLFRYNWNNSLFLIHHIHNYTSCTTAAVEKLHNFLHYQKLLICHNNRWWCQNSSTIAIFSGNISIPRFDTNCLHKKTTLDR